MATGLEAPYALLASAISMIGGHGAAGAYGKTFVSMGYPAGLEVGMAAATFGLISAVLVGGPLARVLIERHHLTPDMSEDFKDTGVENVNAATGEKLDGLTIIKNVTAILVCMAIGTAIALMTLRLWELSGLLGGVILVVAAQVLFMVLVSYFIVFRILGSNYDAAVMCAGLCGHGLGATPSAIVNMTAVKEKYGMSRKAFMIVPIVGAFLVDIIYQPQTIAFIKYFVHALK